MAKRPCAWEIHLRKCRATWWWEVKNPSCGSFASNLVGPKREALARAKRGIPTGTTVPVLTLDCYGRKVLKRETIVV